MDLTMVIMGFQQAVKAVQAYKAAKAQWDAENPAGATQAPDTQELIDLLQAEAEQVQAHADRLVAKYASQAAPATDGGN